MARMQFGGGPEDVYLIPDSEGDLQQAGGIAINLYTAETGGTAITDLQRLNGTAITYVTTSDGSDGRAIGAIAPFLGPDNVYEMWAGPSGQPRFLMQASNLGSALGGTAAALTAHISDINGHSTRLQDLLEVDSASVGAATNGQTLLYDASSGWWEAGPASSMTGALWVAATDAPAAFDAAPYQCDGIADDVEINAALNNVYGMPVMLSPGTFTLAAPIQLLGEDDVEIEVTRRLHGSGTYATTIVVGSGVSSGIFLGGAVCPHVSDLGIQVVGASHGIQSTKSVVAEAGNRSFWHGSIKNVAVRGPWDGSHTGWGMKLASGFRYVVENIEISGTLNGIQVLNETFGFNCGDATFLRCFVEIIGTNGIAYQVNSPTGSANQVVFNTCHGYAQPANTGTYGWRFDGVGGTGHIRLVNCNAEQFVTAAYTDTYAYDIDIDFVHVTLRNSATLFDLDGFNGRFRCGRAYLEASATATIVDDDCTYAFSPNVIGPIGIYGSVGSTANAEIADTAVVRDVTFDGSGTFAGIAMKRPPAVVHHKTMTLTDAATITIDAQTGDDFRVTLGGNRTLAAPTNPSDGQHLTLLVTQDATGSRTLTWNAAFVFGTITNALTTTASRRDLFEFVYHSGLAKWLVLAASKNLT